eukprot:scaffold31587_cov51-Phaeocystis_antarctica.AAC.1
MAGMHTLDSQSRRLSGSRASALHSSADDGLRQGHHTACEHGALRPWQPGPFEPRGRLVVRRYVAIRCRRRAPLRRPPVAAKPLARAVPPYRVHSQLRRRQRRGRRGPACCARLRAAADVAPIGRGLHAVLQVDGGGK